MSWKPTIITFVIACLTVLAALLTGGDRFGIERTSAPGAARPLLADGELPIDNVTRITLERRDQPRLVFERGEEGRWEQTEPFAHPLERITLRRLITAATEVEIVDELEMAATGAEPPPNANDWTPGDLGLEPPEARVTYQWDDGSLAIELGRRTIAGRAYLRQAEDQRVFVSNQALHRQAVELNPREWRDRTLFTGMGIESDRIIRTIGETRLVIERDRRRWLITEPIQTRIDPQVRDQLIQSLAAARSGGFIADQPRDLSRFGLEPPAAMIEVVTEANDSHHRLRIGSTAGAGTQDRFGLVEGRPTVVRIPARVLQMLLIHPEDLADPSGSGMVAADVKTVRINGPAGDFRIRRDLERWHAIDHDGEEVPRELMDEFLAVLTEWRADDVILQEYPRELEIATVTFHGFDDRPRDTVRVLRDPETGRFALENGDNVLRVFSEQIPLRLSPVDFGLTE